MARPEVFPPNPSTNGWFQLSTLVSVANQCSYIRIQAIIELFFCQEVSSDMVVFEQAECQFKQKKCDFIQENV